MATTVLITNLSDAAVSVDEIYTELGASGAANDSVSITRSVAQLDSMPALQAMIAAGTVSAVVTESSECSNVIHPIGSIWNIVGHSSRCHSGEDRGCVIC